MSTPLRPAEAESRRFGLAVARAASGAAPDAVADALLAQGIDVAIVRLDAARCGDGARFDALGLAPLHADTLSTWAFDLGRCEAPAPLPPGGPLRPARADDLPALAALVAQVFADYPNHYRANPLFAPQGAVDGYAEWAAAHLGDPARSCWVHEDEGRIVALACAAHDAASGTASGNLHGVARSHAGRGIYTAMIRATIAHYAALGLRRLTIATQAGNLAVQRTWARLGFQPERCEHTYHLNPLFGRALRATPTAPAAADAADALLRQHARAHGAAAGAAVRVHLRRPGEAAQALRSAAVPRRDGARAATTLAFGGDGRVLGWAMSDRIP